MKGSYKSEERVLQGPFSNLEYDRGRKNDNMKSCFIQNSSVMTKIDGTLKNRLECEIEAQQYLLDNVSELGLTEPEIVQTQIALETYRRELSKMKGADS